ncbi:MAG: hypothetical protein AAFQ94_01715 [Bacteroidota bacterium]
MAVSFIEYKGKKILHIDYSKAKSQEEMINILHQAEKEFQKSEKRLRSLTDMTDAYVGLDYMNELKRITPTSFAPKAHKAAILGVNDLKSILMKGYNNSTKGNMLIFRTKQEALDYLVS